jgi:hypothetical protein
MQVVWWVLGFLGGLVGLVIAWTVYLAVILRLEDERTVGLAYYGLPPEGRAAFKRWLRFHARLLGPVIALSRYARLEFRKARVQHRGIAFPPGSCDAASCERATSYVPRPGDVFVATQMKCGTTWMQHIVYEVLHRGTGDIVATGRTLYGLCPWLEGRKSVGIADAPLLGAERPSRIIKTHLPAALCPRSPYARYIYAARHPAACFASCIDFVRENVGAMAPPLPVFEEWFTTPDLMWWGTWTDHVRGWWDRAQQDGNVLFVTFEEMKRDLPGIARKVAAFLGVAPLSDDELARVVEKCGFAYMQQHQDHFEMHPPHILQTNAELFKRGTADRHKDVPADARRRIMAWAARGLEGSTFPLAATYPDVAAAGPA